MHTVALSWRQAETLAMVLLASSVALQFANTARLRVLGPFLRESGLLAGLYGLWQLAGTLAVVGTEGAFARARWILRTERDWHLPSELDVQHLIAPHPLLTQACNLYYATMHFPSLFALLIWLFARHRDRYGQVRTTVVGLTAACFVIQLLPVAPPRLLPAFGFVDTAEQYGQSVYAAFGAIGADQLSAMPSVHVGWAVLVALAAITISPSRWRWLVLAHPIFTAFVVSATANHFWLDGLVAVAVLLAALSAQAGGRRVVVQMRTGRSAGAPVREDELVAAM
ncbi:MAG: phosphatase PAP2 family protein [Actinomycetota bacterium]